jgi:cell division transport system permease protein
MIGYRLAAWRELPVGTYQSGRLLPWVVALLAYVAGLGAAGLIVLDDTLRASEHDLATTMTLQVPAEASKARLDTVLAMLRQTPGIVSVHLLEPAETARLLEPWLGPVQLDELPVPRLIDLRVDPDGGTDVAGLQRQLASVAPGSRLDDHRRSPHGMHAAVRRIEGILAGSITVAALLIAASTACAVRAALIVGHSVGELLHALGAADSDIARLFAVRSLRLGLLGGVIGAVVALITILALSGVGLVVQLPAPIAVNAVADWRVWGILTGIVPAAGIIAMVSTWAAVLRRLASMP